MNDEELRELFGELIIILRNSGLGWVLRQVVAEGDEMDDAEIDTSLLATQTMRSNLQGVLNALEMVLVETVQMEIQIREFFESEVEDIALSRRELDVPEGDTAFAINRLAGQQRVQASNQIRNIIEDLEVLIS
ncbi:MAG: hypothetical protein CL610_20045 [Anaerolineaceae bacterium]|nr:hypothetical protein [Anaerolineaceae bacterium]